MVCVIPARGGSKGLPGKNIARVGGVPLIARAVAAARAASSIGTVLVSTDDDGIAAAAVAEGARIVRRPASLSGDEASSESAVLHALDALPEQPDIVVFVQATSPFISPADLEHAVELIRTGRFDSVFAARSSHGFLWRTDADGQAIGVNHDATRRLRRQEREPEFLETGAFYAFRTDGFRAAGFRFFGRVGIVPVAELSGIEIDTADDLELARASAPLHHRPHVVDVDAVVTDFDGVHTDDRVSLTFDGREAVTVNRSDGMGVERLRRNGVPFLILSKEQNPVVSSRAAKLRVAVLQGVDDKLPALQAWADSIDVPLSRIAYLGNDVNDLECLRAVGWPVAVADAHPEVRAAARLILRRRGGDGAVRELSDAVLSARVPTHQKRELP